MLVSIVMSVYNGARFLREAIESVLNQSWKNFEFIIIDDGSIDNSSEIIKEYSKTDPRVYYYRQENKGMAEALNWGIKISRGEWVVRMDCDDVMMPNRIERQLTFVQKFDDLAVASCLVYYINNHGKIVGKNSSPLRSRDDFQRILQENELIGFHHPGVILRKKVVEEVGGYRGKFWPAEDIDLWNRIAERGYLILVQQEYLLKYRIHAGSVSVADARMARLKVHWLKECMLRRRSGLPEIDSFEEFLHFRKLMPFFEQLNQERKDLAKIFYKRGVYSFSQGNYLKSIINLLVTGILQPSYLFNQLATKSFYK